VQDGWMGDRAGDNLSTAIRCCPGNVPSQSSTAVTI